jgi:hypothetical protein
VGAASESDCGGNADMSAAFPAGVGEFNLRGIRLAEHYAPQPALASRAARSAW